MFYTHVHEQYDFTLVKLKLCNSVMKCFTMEFCFIILDNNDS